MLDLLAANIVPWRAMGDSIRKGADLEKQNCLFGVQTRNWRNKRYFFLARLFIEKRLFYSFHRWNFFSIFEAIKLGAQKERFFETIVKMI